MPSVTAGRAFDVRDAQPRQNNGVLPPSENKQYYPALDGLRAAAVLLVFWGHYEGGAHPLLSWGWAGVDYFFVLSGFLITGILYDTRDAQHRFRTFYVRRVLRIFPLYYGVFLLALLLTPIFHWWWNPASLLWLTFLGNYGRFLFLHSALPAGAVEHLVARPPFPYSFLAFTGHFWSLCVEEQFYLLWPAVVYLVRRRETLRNVCGAVVLLCLAARVACLYLLPHSLLAADFLSRATPLRADALLLGGFVALCLRGRESDALERCARPLLFAFAVGFAVFELTCLSVSPSHAVWQPDFKSPILPTVGFTLIDLSGALLLLCLLQPRGVFRIFTLRPLRALGKISYGFYVFHDLLHQAYAALAHALTHHRGPAVNLTALLALAGTTILSYASFRFYETPFLRLKRFFTAEPENARA